MTVFRRMRLRPPPRIACFRHPCRSAPGALACLCLLAGCATVDEKLGDQPWYQKSKEVSGKAFAVTESAASKTYARMQKYLAEKDVLKTFQDAGEHSETAVLG